ASCPVSVTTLQITQQNFPLIHPIKLGVGYPEVCTAQNII
ncbi:MAG: hypothetical protein ACI9OH_003392, partial [Oleispira sp.]